MNCTNQQMNNMYHTDTSEYRPASKNTCLNTGIDIPWTDNSHLNGQREMTDMREYMKNHSCMNSITSMANIERKPTWNNDNTSIMNSDTAMMNGNMSTQNNSSTGSFVPETVTNTAFLPAYLSQFIGNWIRADFLVGNNIEERVGILHEVGASYIIIQAVEPATLVVCDLYSVKFVKIILDDEYPRLLNR